MNNVYIPFSRLSFFWPKIHFFPQASCPNPKPLTLNPKLWISIFFSAGIASKGYLDAEGLRDCILPNTLLMLRESRDADIIEGYLMVLFELIPRLDQATLGGDVADLALSKVKSCDILKCHKNKEIHPWK